MTHITFNEQQHMLQSGKNLFYNIHIVGNTGRSH